MFYAPGRSDQRLIRARLAPVALLPLQNNHNEQPDLVLTARLVLAELQAEIATKN
jgi:hypothetical protein